MKKSKSKPHSKPQSKPEREPPPKASATQVRYKVVEISNVDESALESVLNEWIPQGWTFEGIHFAMRESSRRPAMAFVLLTRSEPLRATARAASARVDSRIKTGPDPWARLRALAGVNEEAL